MREPFALLWWMPVAVFLGAFAVRLLNIGIRREAVDDSFIHAVTGPAYVEHGLLGPDYWWTQPVKHLLLYLSAAVFGDDPIGWRMREVVLGSLAVVMVFLIARRLFGRVYPAVAAAVLLALDPLGIAMSHNTGEDVGASFWMLLSILLCLYVLRADTDLNRSAAGVAIGIAVATRWWAAAPAFIMLLVMLWRSRRSVRSLAREIAFFVMLPLTVYVLAYLPWFAGGHTVPEFVQLQLDALASQGDDSAMNMLAELRSIAGPRRWFTSTMGMGWATGGPQGRTAFSIMMNDPLLWVLFLPSTGYLLWLSVKRRKASGVLVSGSFILLFLFFMTAPRTIFLYSASAITGLGFVAIGFAADRLLGRNAWKFLAAATAWSLYLYPLSVAIPVPASWYSWILKATGFL